MVILVTAVLFLCGTGLHPVPWLTWFAPLPALWAAPRLPWRSALVAAVAGYGLGLTGLGGYMITALEMPRTLVVAVLTGFTAVFAFVVMLFRALVLRGQPFTAAVIAPAAWATAEWLVATVGPYGANWSLANSQADLLPPLQIASVAGVFAVSFLVFGTSSALAAALAPSITAQHRAAILASAALALCLTLGYGMLRLQPNPAGPAVRAVLVATPLAGGSDPAHMARSQADSDLSWLHAADVRGGVVVFPEKDFAVDQANVDEVTHRFSAAAREAGATIVLGVEEHAGQSVFNTALIFSPDGTAPSAYRKHYPIVGVEDDITAGTVKVFVPGFDNRIGVAICADLGHPGFGRDYARAGARLLAVPALDFGVDDWSQSRVQMLRGVESGFATIRAARRGYLTITDRYGRVVAEARTDDSNRTTTTISARVELPDRRPTWYARLPDLFGGICLFAVCAVTVRLAVGHRRSRRATPAEGVDLH